MTTSTPPLTTLQAAAELGITRSRILQLIRANRLRAAKFGRDWTIRPDALDAVRVRIPGRPRKSTTTRPTP
jgi:excisionase family DNA binding protein